MEHVSVCNFANEQARNTIRTIDIEGKVITAALPAARKLSYSVLKVKQLDIVMGNVSACDVFTTLNTRYGETFLLSPALHL